MSANEEMQQGAHRTVRPLLLTTDFYLAYFTTTLQRLPSATTRRT